MSSKQPTSSDGPTRRDFLERGAAATGAVVTLGIGGSAVAPQFSPVGRAQGIACGGLCIGAAAAGTGVAVGWALGEWDPLESDSAPDGLTPDALEQRVYETVRTRESTNASTFVDNRNILDGIEHAAYGDGKVAAIEKLNQEETQQVVQDAATTAADDYEATIIQNLLKSWNESSNEVFSLVETVQGHSDLTLDSIFDGMSLPAASNAYSFTFQGDAIYPETETFELANGETFDIKQLVVEGEHSGGDASHPADVLLRWSPKSHNDDRLYSYGGTYEDPADGDNPASYEHLGLYWSMSSGSVEYMRFTEWNSLLTDIETIFDEVRDGLITWVEGVYGDVQAGELDTEDLLTPRELAQMSADEEGVNQAIADLMALNIPVDLEREATISVESENETATLSGMIAPTTPPSGGIVSGETYDPSTMEGDIYFSYDVSQGSAIWTAYDSAGVDGGIVTFTTEPYEGTLFRINTTAGEQATVAAEDFSNDDGGTPDDDSDDVWTVDISEQVETAITEIDEVEMVAESGDTQYKTIILDQPFTVEKIENSETGEEADSMDFTQDEPQDDTNYVSEEEWQEMQERNQELIDKYEDSKNDDGGSIIGDPSALADEYGGAVAGLVIIFGAVSVVAGIVTGWIPGMGD